MIFGILKDYKYLIVICSLLSIISYFFFDRSIALSFHYDNPYRPMISFISEIGTSTWYLVGSIILYGYFHFIQRNLCWRDRALFLFMAIAISGIAGNIIKVIGGRARPNGLFEHDYWGFYGWGTQSLFQSFPSGHSITAAALATVIALYFPRYRVVAVILALVVGATRVVLNNHYPSDVFIGLLIGFLSVRIIYEYVSQKKLLYL